jgi:hypothetical protein
LKGVWTACGKAVDGLWMGRWIGWGYQVENLVENLCKSRRPTGGGEVQKLNMFRWVSL